MKIALSQIPIKLELHIYFGKSHLEFLQSFFTPQTWPKQNVKELGERGQFVNSVGMKGDGMTMLTQRGVKDSAVAARSGVTQCSSVTRLKIVIFAVNRGIILLGAGRIAQ